MRRWKWVILEGEEIEGGSFWRSEEIEGGHSGEERRFMVVTLEGEEIERGYTRWPKAPSSRSERARPAGA